MSKEDTTGTKPSLSNFASWVDENVLARGRDYMRGGAVHDLEEIESGEWGAIVHGTEKYEVRVALNGDEICEYGCTCPYDLGPICKHVVAVLFVLSARRDTARDHQTKESMAIGKKRRTVGDRLDDVLAGFSHGDLKEIVRGYAQEDRVFRSHLLTHATRAGGYGDREEYRQIIQDSLHAAEDQHGFIGYWDGDRALKGAHELLSCADDFVTQKDPERAVLIYQVVLEEVVPALQYADDSNGEFGDCITAAMEGIERCARSMRESRARQELFDYCMRESSNERFEGWTDWRFDLLRSAVSLIDSHEQRQVLDAHLTQILESPSTNNFSEKYVHERAVELTLEIIRRCDSGDAVAQFINTHVQYTPIRRLAIEDALKIKKYERVKELAREGITHDTNRGYPGLVNEWLTVLLTVAERERDTAQIRDYAQKLFFERGEFEYYEKLKKSYKKEQWQEALSKLLEALQHASNRARSEHTFTEIFVREEMWDTLLAFLKEHPSRDMLDRCYPYLASRYPDALSVMYEHVCRALLKDVSGRGQYQDACRILRRMKKLGAKERVQELVAEFQTVYKNRRALREELLKV